MPIRGAIASRDSVTRDADAGARAPGDVAACTVAHVSAQTSIQLIGDRLASTVPPVVACGIDRLRSERDRV